MFKKRTFPVYYGADGNYYVVSTVPMLNGIESADYQPTSFYNDGVEAQAFTDIRYLGNGVYRIPSSRYQYCFTEQYVSDTQVRFYGISFGLRIQVLYGFTPNDEVKISADVLYPDMTERFLPAKLIFWQEQQL